MKTKLFDRFLRNPEEVSCDGSEDPKRSRQDADGSCGCGPKNLESSMRSGAQPSTNRREPEGIPIAFFTNLPWVTGRIDTAEGPVPRVDTRFGWSERLGSWRVRWGIGRMSYTVPPGVYAVGAPDSRSPVFVTANYKLSFDRLRKSLAGFDGWILVLDTRGINVWCAAGKGTFGTDELVHRIESTGIKKIIDHRTLILPQLGAPGIASHEVTKRTGLKVVFGPVGAEDLPRFLKSGMKATPNMRRVRFGLRDRIVLTSVELAGILKHPVFLVLFGLWLAGRLGVPFLRFDFPSLLGAVLVGTVLVPLLLPWIPGRAFALKGALLGLIWAAAALLLFQGLPEASAHDLAQAAAYLLFLPALSSFFAMSFTGSSTITCLSGVVKEMRTAVPLIALSAVLGLAAFFTSLFV